MYPARLKPGAVSRKALLENERWPAWSFRLPSLAAQEAAGEARRKAACSSVGLRSLLVAHGLDTRVRSCELQAGRRALP